jgi:hydrogenase maturation factor
MTGYSAETSGGLFIMIPPERLEAFQSELLEEFGQKSWVIGEVVEGSEKKVIFGNDKGEIEVIQIEQFVADDY